jgi:hypothetical protein
MNIIASAALAAMVSSTALADDPDTRSRPSHYVTGFFGQSQIILGSEDPRFGGGLSYAYGGPEKRFTKGNVTGQLVYEGYIDRTQSNGGDGFSGNSTYALGGLAYGRWYWPLDHLGNGVYADLGWGLQIADRTTLDLESSINSTPVAGFGGVFRDGKKEYLIGLRFLHISNGGLVKPNFGQNEVFLTLGFRY